jgi:hypothetical protein
MKHPRFGHTRTGLPVHARTFDHLPSRTAVDRFNARLAVRITKMVGSMWCAYVFSVLALVSFPATLTLAGMVPKGFFPAWLIAAGLIALIAWIAQTFLQLVLLSIILVGQDVQSQAADARAAKTLEDAETIVDRLDEQTQGGIKAILDVQASDARAVLAAVAGVDQRLAAIQAAAAEAAAKPATAKLAGKART